jgi:hypothetical protein
VNNLTLVAQLTAPTAVGCGALLGIVAVGIMVLVLAGLMIWAGDSMKRLMPVVTSIMVLNVALQSVRVWHDWKTRTNRERLEQQQYHQTEPQPTQTNQLSLPSATSFRPLSDPSRQATAWQQCKMQRWVMPYAFRATSQPGFCLQAASAAHLAHSDLPYGVTMPNDPKLSHADRQAAPRTR